MLEASIGIKNSWKYEKDLIQLLNTFRIKKYIIQLGYFWAKFTTNLKSFCGLMQIIVKNLWLRAIFLYSLTRTKNKYKMTILELSFYHNF